MVSYKKISWIGLLWVAIVWFSGCTSKKSVTGSDSQQLTKPKPSWVTNQPLDNDYYVGIGMVRKSRSGGNYQQEAHKNALANLASEIKVTISNNSVLLQTQRDNRLRQDFEEAIKVKVKEDLEGFEVVDSWGDEEEYWVYYRLSKTLYKEQKHKKYEAAVQQAFQLFVKSYDLLQHDQYIPAFKAKVEALTYIEPYLGQPVKVIYQDQEVFLGRELISGLQQLLNQLKLEPHQNQLKAKAGQGLAKPILVAAWNNGRPVADVPIRLLAEPDHIEATSSSKTDADSYAYFEVKKFKGFAPFLTLKFEPDLERMIEVNGLTPLMKELLLGLSIVSTSVNVTIERVRLMLIVDEVNMGSSNVQPILMPILVRKLAERGYEFVEFDRDADFVVSVEANARPNGETHQMYTADLFMNITVWRPSTQTQVYQNQLSGIKGVQLDYKRAGEDAFRKAEIRMDRFFIDDLVQSMQY